MNPMYTMPANLLSDGMETDEIEQRIIRAYVRLAGTMRGRGGSRTVNVTQFRTLEVRLSETPFEQLLPGMPPFWLEVYSQTSGCVIDSCGCTTFDACELADAVGMIERAMRRPQLLH